MKFPKVDKKDPFGLTEMVDHLKKKAGEGKEVDED